MPAEWQMRQLSLIASEPGPFGNVRSLVGRSTLTDLSENFSSARAAGNAKTTPATTATGSIVCNIPFPSCDFHGCLLDDVAHEATRIPIGRVGLRFAAAVGASDHEHLLSSDWHGEVNLPLAEAVLALVISELRLLPALAAVT